MATHAFNAGIIINLLRIPVNCLNRTTFHTHIAFSAFVGIDLWVCAEKFDHPHECFAVAFLCVPETLGQLKTI
jgi:hypothetical protein